MIEFGQTCTSRHCEWHCIWLYAKKGGLEAVPKRQAAKAKAEAIAMSAVEVQL